MCGSIIRTHQALTFLGICSNVTLLQWSSLRDALFPHSPFLPLTLPSFSPWSSCLIYLYLLGHLYTPIVCLPQLLIEYKLHEGRDFVGFLHCFNPSTLNRIWHVVYLINCWIKILLRCYRKIKNRKERRLKHNSTIFVHNYIPPNCWRSAIIFMYFLFVLFF